MSNTVSFTKLLQNCKVLQLCSHLDQSQNIKKREQGSCGKKLYCGMYVLLCCCRREDDLMWNDGPDGPTWRHHSGYKTAEYAKQLSDKKRNMLWVKLLTVSWRYYYSKRHKFIPQMYIISVHTTIVYINATFLLEIRVPGKFVYSIRCKYPSVLTLPSEAMNDWLERTI